MSETPDGLAIDPASLMTEAVPDAQPPSPMFKAGDWVKASRRPDQLMRVLDSQSPDAPLPQMYQCQADAGLTPRWFREDDLVRA